MNLNRVIVALSVVGLVVMAGCAGVEWTTQAMETDSKQYAQPLKLTKNQAKIIVFWKEESEIGAFCGNGGNACALNVGDETYIYTPKPRGWNDSPRLRRLGHEVLHALGGKHE